MAGLLQGLGGLSRKQKRMLEKKFGPMGDMDEFMSSTSNVDSKETAPFNERALELYKLSNASTEQEEKRLKDHMRELLKGKAPQEEIDAVKSQLAPIINLQRSVIKFQKEVETNPTGPISTFSTRQSSTLPILVTRNEEELLKIQDDNLLESEFGLKRNWPFMSEPMRDETWEVLEAMARHGMLFSFDVIEPCKEMLPKDMRKIFDDIIRRIRRRLEQPMHGDAEANEAEAADIEEDLKSMGASMGASFMAGGSGNSNDTKNMSAEEREFMEGTVRRQSELIEELQNTCKGQAGQDPAKLRQTIIMQMRRFQREIKQQSKVQAEMEQRRKQKQQGDGGDAVDTAVAAAAAAAATETETKKKKKKKRAKKSKSTEAESVTAEAEPVAAAEPAAENDSEEDEDPEETAEALDKMFDNVENFIQSVDEIVANGGDGEDDEEDDEEEDEEPAKQSAEEDDTEPKKDDH